MWSHELDYRHVPCAGGHNPAEDRHISPDDGIVGWRIGASARSKPAPRVTPHPHIGRLRSGDPPQGRQLGLLGPCPFARSGPAFCAARRRCRCCRRSLGKGRYRPIGRCPRRPCCRCPAILRRARRTMGRDQIAPRRRKRGRGPDARPARRVNRTAGRYRHRHRADDRVIRRRRRPCHRR